MSQADEIKKLKELLDSGVLTQDEYDAQKERLLNSDNEVTPKKIRKKPLIIITAAVVSVIAVGIILLSIFGGGGVKGDLREYLLSGHEFGESSEETNSIGEIDTIFGYRIDHIYFDYTYEYQELYPNFEGLIMIKYYLVYSDCSDAYDMFDDIYKQMERKFGEPRIYKTNSASWQIDGIDYIVRFDGERLSVSAYKYSEYVEP